jgi:lipopolysaccharide export system protein LptC
MTVAGRVDTYDQRADILGSILLRNRVVGVLRVLVPAIGIGAFLLLVSQIYVVGLARQYGVAGIRIDRGNLVVEAPQYAGSGTNGTRYLATAREARTPLAGGSDIDMTDATLELLQADGTTYFATAKTAHLNTATELLNAPGLVDVKGSDGLVGTLHDVDMDNRSEILTSKGHVDLLLPDGTTIVGDDMVRDGKAQTYTFTNATVVVPDLPEAEEGPTILGEDGAISDDDAIGDIIEELR